MSNPYRHPISTPVPELQGIATIAKRDATPTPTIPAGMVAEGWQLVPIKPTPEMIEAWANASIPAFLVAACPDDEANRIVATNDWSAMLAAAPKQAEQQGGEEAICAVLERWDAHPSDPSERNALIARLRAAFAQEIE